MSVSGLGPRIRVGTLGQDQLRRRAAARGSPAASRPRPRGSRVTVTSLPPGARSDAGTTPPQSARRRRRAHPGDHAAVEAGQPGVVRGDLLLHHPAGRRRLRLGPRPRAPPAGRPCPARCLPGPSQAPGPGGSRPPPCHSLQRRTIRVPRAVCPRGALREELSASPCPPTPAMARNRARRVTARTAQRGGSGEAVGRGGQGPRRLMHHGHRRQSSQGSL